MSHLVLVTEVTAVDPEAGGSDAEQDSDEQRPLLRREDTDCGASTSQWEDAKVTTSYSLIPDLSLPAQVREDGMSQDVCLCYSLNDIEKVLASRIWYISVLDNLESSLSLFQSLLR